MSTVEDDLEPTSPEDAKPFIEGGAPSRQQSASASSGSDEDRRSSARGWSISTVAVLGSLVALAICATIALRSRGSMGAAEPRSAAPSAASAPSAPSTISARALFASPQHVDVVTDNFMQMAKGTLDDFDRPILRAQVAEGLNKSMEDLTTQYPEASRALDVVQLNAAQQAAVLKSIHAEGDPRVLQMGQEIAGLVHSSMSASHDKEGVKRSLSDYVSSRAPLIRQLREEACPPEVPGICDDDDDDMQLTMDDNSVRLTKNLDNNWDLEMDMSQPTSAESSVVLPARRLKSGKGGSSGFGLTQGLQMASMASKYMHKFKKLAKSFGISMPEIKKALKKVNVSQLMTCVLENAAKADPTSMMKCGAQFASAAMSVMKSLAGFGGGSSSSSKGGKGGGSSRRRKSMFSGFP